VVDDPKLPEPIGFAKEKGEKRLYWLSFDRTHLTVKYGKGYHMVETTLMAYDFYQVNKAQASFKVPLLLTCT
jgi:hypothetical protein